MRAVLLFLILCLLCLPLAAQDEPQPPAQPPAPRRGVITAANDPNAQRARNLLDQTIQALGGDAYLNLQDLSEDGRGYRFYHGDPTGAGSPYWHFWKWPQKNRYEFTKQRDVIEITNGDQGWEITYKGVHLMDPDDFKEYLRNKDYALDFVLRSWLKDPATALIYEGAGLANNRAADQVTLIDSRDQAVTLFIDSSTHLPIKKAYELRDPATGYRDQEAEIYDNYHLVQGIATPLSITRFHNGDMLSQRFRHEVRYNTGLSDDKFTATLPPEPAKKK